MSHLGPPFQCNKYKCMKNFFRSHNDLFNPGELVIHSVIQHTEVIDLATASWKSF